MQKNVSTTLKTSGHSLNLNLNKTNTLPINNNRINTKKKLDPEANQSGFD